MRQPISRAVVEQLRALHLRRDLADAEARGYLAGVAATLGLLPTQIAAFEDGDEPVLIIAEPPPPEESPEEERENA